MKKFKRTLSLLLCLIMVACLVPTTVFAEGSEPEKYNVWVAGIQVTSENASDILGGGEASYDAETKTLTVKKDIAAGDATVIESNTGINVEVQGDVTLSSNKYGIDLNNGSLKITGGKLVVKAERIAVTAVVNISIDCEELDLTGSFGVYTLNGSVKLVGDKITMNADENAVHSRNNVNINCKELKLNAGGTGIYSMDGAIAVSSDKVSIDGAYGINSAKKSVELKCSTPNDGNITVSAYFDAILAADDITVQCDTLDLKSISTDSSYDPHHYSLHLKGDGKFIYPADANVVAATEVDGTFEAYDETKNATYDHVKIGTPTPTTYTVTFDSDGGSAVTAQNIEAGQKATKPADPTKSGYDFEGWTLNGSAYDFNTAVNGDITLVATWEQQQVVPTTYTVSFAANGGTGTMADVTGISGEYTLPENGFTAPDGKQFKAWSVGGVEKAVGDKITVTADTTVTAVWETIPAGHTCDIKPVAKDEPSCTEGGKEAYYKCDGCGKCYEDALGAKEITDIDAWGNLEKLGHTESDWKSDKDNHWKECTVTACGVIIEDSKAAHKDDNKDGKCDVCEYNVGVPGDSSDDDKPSDNPQTGDNSMIWLWIALLFVSGAGVVATVYGKKRFSVK